MILINPMRYPPSVASFESALEAGNANPMIEGYWDWKENGTTTSDCIIFKSGGVIEQEN